jgi:hypothetical protein
MLFVMLVAILWTAVPAAGAPNGLASRPAAAKAAVFHVLSDAKSDTSGWTGGKISVSNGTDLFDPSGNPIGYRFDVQVASNPAGFVVVGNQLDDYPILSFSYHHPVAAEIDNTLSHVKKPIASHRVVYMGGASFALDLMYKDGTSEVQDVHGRQLPRESKKPRTAIPRSDSARAFWKLTEATYNAEIGTTSDGVTDVDPDTWESGYDVAHYGVVPGVPFIYQFVYGYDGNGYPYWSGCSPTAGAMIMQYWASNGYPNLGDTDESVVYALRNTMKTSPLWNASCPCYAGNTLVANIPSGMQTYARNKGYSTAVSTNLGSGTTFAKIQTEVDAWRPGYLNLQGQTYYGNHGVTLVGYREYVKNGVGSAGHQYMVIHDTWDSHPYDVFLAYGRNYSSLTLIKFNPSP